MNDLSPLLQPSELVREDRDLARLVAPVPLVVRRSRRARRVVVRLTADGLVVSAPPWTAPVVIAAFLTKSADWVRARTGQYLDERAQLDATFVPGGTLTVLGERFCIEAAHDGLACGIHEDLCEILVTEAAIEAGPETIRREVAAHLMELADRRLVGRCQELAYVFGHPPTRIEVMQFKSSWGVAYRDGRVRLHWIAVTLRPELIDYLIVHELAHLIEMNHSPRFWAMVEAFDPLYWTHRHELMTEGGVVRRLFEASF